ncbi:MAG: nucleoside hydrolase [Candidatus Absconditicoccaceae bacterium]
MGMKAFSSEEKVRLLVDCDPGADDVFALLWLLIQHKFAEIPLEIVGITTVGGNVAADKTYENVLRLCAMVDEQRIPIGKDHRQIVSEDASYIHGNDGIGNLGAMLPPVQYPQEVLDSVTMIIEALEKYPDELTIIATGPLTNLALAEEKKPGILKRAKKIIAMGGAIEMQGNVTPTAEFNIFYDAPSAAKVFSASSRIVLLPLDLTTSMPFTMRDMENCFISTVNNTQKQEFMRALTKFIIATNMKFRETGYQEGFYIHDAHTVGILLYPHLYKGSFMQVNIETQGEYTKGQTVVDRRNIVTLQTNCFVAMEFKKEQFLEAITQDFKLFDFS